MLSSAFLAYIGFFDFFYRQILLKEWRKLLTSQSVLMRDDLNMITYLSEPNEVLTW
jgi:hypothetical protein